MQKDRVYMGRRSDHTREELTQLAIEAACELAAEGGLRRLTARRVAEKIGYTPGTLYNLFKNFDYLIMLVTARVLDELTEYFKECHDLKSLAEAYLGYAQAEPHLWSLLFEHHLPPGEELPDWFEDKIKNLFMTVENAMRHDFPEVLDLAHNAQVFWAAVHGITSLAWANKLKTVKAADARTLIQHFINHYRPL